MNEKIVYELKTRKGKKGVSLKIIPGGKIVVTKPKLYPTFLVEKFIESKSEWILLKQKEMQKYKPKLNKNEEKVEYLKNKKLALQIVKEKIEKLNKHYDFRFNKISIRKQGTRWGSCSSRKNLSFNYKIVFLDSFAQEYLVAHELCHLKEMNHSKNFWALVALAVPDYKIQKQKLKNFHLKEN